MDVQFIRRGVLLAFAFILLLSVRTTATPLPAANIQIWWCTNPTTEITCICMYNNDTQEIRSICPEEGGCWDDSGWKHYNDTQPVGSNPLSTYYDTQGNLYVIVGPNQGGVFGTSTGTCLPFTSNGSNTIMFPASIL